MSLHGFTGLVIGPDHPGYDDARAVFNGMIDRRPLAIYRCTTADDVVAVVNHARDEGLALSVYGGGHSVTGAAVVDGGVVCDMRGLKGIDIDPSTRTVRAEAGLTWGEFDAATIDTLVGHATAPVSPMTQVLVAAGGGAISRVDDDADAFGERHAPFNIHYLSMWADPADDATNIAYTREIAAAMKPWTTGAVYLNYIGDEGYDRVKAGFGPEKYARLQAIKDVWDPHNVFRHNQNIPPSGWTG